MTLPDKTPGLVARIATPNAPDWLGAGFAPLSDSSLDAYSTLSALAPDARFSLVGLDTAKGTLMGDAIDDFPIEVPRGFVLGAGVRVTAAFVGEPGQLASVRKVLDDQVDRLRTLLEEGRKASPDMPPQRHTVFALVDYIATSHLDALEVSEGEESLVYSMQVSESEVGALAAMFLVSENLSRIQRSINRARRSDEPVPSESVFVMKATRRIEAGTRLAREDVVATEVPVRFLPPNPVYADALGPYIGRELQVTVSEGAMLLTSDFVPVVEPKRE
jgi:hypothetical protein